MAVFLERTAAGTRLRDEAARHFLSFLRRSVSAARQAPIAEPLEGTGRESRRAGLRRRASFRHHLPDHAESRRLPEVLVLDVFLQQPVRDASDARNWVGPLQVHLPSHGGARPLDLGNRRRGVDYVSVVFPRPFAWHFRRTISLVLRTGGLPGTLLSRALLHPDAAGVVAPCGTGRELRDRQAVRVAALACS